MSRGGDPVPLERALAEMGGDLGLAPPAVLRALFSVWPEAVGPEVAGHARVRSLRAGVLVVEVDAAPWATELRYRAEDLLAALERAAGTPVAQALRVVVAPPAAPPRGAAF